MHFIDKFDKIIVSFYFQIIKEVRNSENWNTY